jgi:mannose-6-phosphate isomerase-like protein (cupin superfamily)
MQASKQDLPVFLGSSIANSRQIEWGEMDVAVESFAAGVRPTPFSHSLPKHPSPFPQWGYMVRGRMRICYGDHEEVISAGELYCLPPGHLPLFDEETEVIEFTPKGAY